MRIKFRKIGRLKYISHLDLQRTFSTGLIRAGIPVWYSKGFNPHPKLVFALTVSVGAESEVAGISVVTMAVCSAGRIAQEDRANIQ